MVTAAPLKPETAILSLKARKSLLGARNFSLRARMLSQKARTLYEHVISFHNGSIACIISQDRPGTSNPLTLDCLIIDEAKFVDFEKLKDETFPASGGYKGHFGMRYCHHGMLIMSDMPATKKGSRFMRYEKECDPELIAAIHGIIHEIWRLKTKGLRKTKPVKN